MLKLVAYDCVCRDVEECVKLASKQSAKETHGRRKIVVAAKSGSKSKISPIF